MKINIKIIRLCAPEYTEPNQTKQNLANYNLT